MKPLILLGVGPHVREMAEMVERINHVQPTWDLLGFITEDELLAEKDWNGYPLLGGPEAVQGYPEAYFAFESEWCRLDLVPLERCATLIDPSCVVSRSAQIGHGCVVYPGCFIGYRAWLGNFVFCLGGSTINHDNHISDRVMLASRVTLAGGVQVEERVYLGQGCNVRQNIHIGSRSLVGMGSVVVKDVPSGCVVVGNPARIVSDSNTVHRAGSGMGSGEYQRFQGE